MEGISRIGFIDDLEVYVNTDDSGSVPHFHIKSKDGSFHSSVCIETPEYYFHDGDRDKLDPGTAAKLQRFMQSPVPFGKYRLSYWECLCISWEANNQGSQIKAEKQPDYELLFGG